MYTSQQRSQSRIPVTASKTSDNQQATGSFRVPLQTIDHSQALPEIQKYSSEKADLIAAKIGKTPPTGDAIQRMLQNSTSTTSSIPTKSNAEQSGDKYGEEKNSKSQWEAPKLSIVQRMLQNSAPRALAIQRKLQVGEPGDKYEQEADSMASKVMSMPDSAVQKQTSIGEQIQRRVQAQLIQRVGGGSLPGGGNIESQLNSSQGGGNPLSEQVRAYMEPRFGTDFSQVRVHTDTQAVQMNRELGAQAFTHGRNIYYGAGKAPAVNELTAHELTHVVQQTGGASPQPQEQLPQHPITETPSTSPEDRILNPLSYEQNSLPSIQRKEITAGELGCQDDGSGTIFDAKVKEGKKFSLEAETDRDPLDWQAAISAYTQAIRPVGNVVGNNGYTDKKLTFQNNLPSASKWGQKKVSFVNTAKQDLNMPDTITLDSKPEFIYWQTLSNKARDNNRDILRDNNDIGLIDPFLVKIVVRSNTNVAANNWEFLTQFADSGTGYIIKIINGTQEIEGNIATRNDFNSKKDEVVGSNTGYLYSSTHDQGDEAFSNRINSITGTNSDEDRKGKHATGLDAITWLAAEGARFQPVERLGASGSPASCFFIKPNEDNWIGFKYLTTANLMQCWGEKFGRRYGIQTTEVRDIVSVDGKTDKDQPPIGYHYNLTRDEIYNSVG